MNNTDYSDLFLLEEIGKQNERALKELFNKYYAELVQYGTLYLSSSDAEEVVQELFIFIWNKSDSLSINSTLKGYLIASVKNRALNHIRARKNYEGKCLDLYEKYRDIVFSESDHSFWELKEELTNCIEKLPVVQQVTFRLSRFTPMTNREIADQMNVSEKTVEYRLSQALKILKKHFLPTCLMLLLSSSLS